MDVLFFLYLLFAMIPAYIALARNRNGLGFALAVLSFATSWLILPWIIYVLWAIVCTNGKVLKQEAILRQAQIDALNRQKNQ